LSTNYHGACYADLLVEGIEDTVWDTILRALRILYRKYYTEGIEDTVWDTILRAARILCGIPYRGH
jgi:hypothetical protein